MTDNGEDTPKKQDDPQEGSNKLVLSADDRDTIVESLLKKLTEQKKMPGTPHLRTQVREPNTYGYIHEVDYQVHA